MVSATPATAAAAAKSRQSCPTLCNPIDGSPPGSAFPGILQARTLSGVPFPSPEQESEKWKWSCSVVPTLSDPMDCSLPSSSIHGIFQARVLEWSAIAFFERHPWASLFWNYRSFPPEVTQKTIFLLMLVEIKGYKPELSLPPMNYLTWVQVWRE